MQTWDNEVARIDGGCVKILHVAKVLGGVKSAFTTVKPSPSFPSLTSRQFTTLVICVWAIQKRCRNKITYSNAPH